MRSHTTSTRRLPLTLLFCISAAALIAAGCSDDGDSADPTTTTAAPAIELNEDTEQQLSELLETSLGVPGGAVGVFVGDQEWLDYPGDATVPTGEPGPDGETVTEAVPVEADMVWPLRSITKSFTVTLLLQLVDEGLVALDDTIEEFVPGVPNGNQITLAELADMTSGVPEYTNEAWLDAFVADPTRDFTGQELIDFAIAEPAQFAPGTEHVYTNTNTVLLGQVIEQVAGEDFESVLRERILEPLGLERTVYPAGVDDWNGPHATGYQMDDGALTAQIVNFSVFDTAGAMISDVADLRTWGEALATGSLISEESQELRTDVAIPLDEGPEYDNYGMGIGEIDGWWGHTGEGMGFEALVMHNEDLDATIVIYVNMSNIVDEATGEPVHVPTKLFGEIVDVLSGKGG